MVKDICGGTERTSVIRWQGGSGPGPIAETTYVQWNDCNKTCLFYFKFKKSNTFVNKTQSKMKAMHKDNAFHARIKSFHQVITIHCLAELNIEEK